MIGIILAVKKLIKLKVKRIYKPMQIKKFLKIIKKVKLNIKTKSKIEITSWDNQKQN